MTSPPEPEPRFDLETWLRSPGRRAALQLALVVLVAGLSTVQRAELFDARGLEFDALSVFGRQLLWWGSWAVGGLFLVPLAAWTWSRWRSGLLFVGVQLVVCAAAAVGFDALHQRIEGRSELRERRFELDGGRSFDRAGPRRALGSQREGADGPERRGLPGRRSGLFRGLRLQREVLIYWIVVGLGLAVRAYLAGREEARRRGEVELRAERLRAELARAELQSLRSELNPHFLFNALHAVGGLVRSGEAQTALETLSSIGSLLRTTLDRTETQESSLADEVAIIERYLAIERLRFGERLETSISVPAELAAVRVPSLVLLPLVENAVRYAVEPRNEGGSVAIEARRDGDACVIEVRDDGPGFPPEVLELTGPPVADGEERRGIGLANTRARVEMLYGTEAGLELANGAEGGARVRIRVPFAGRAEPRPGRR